MPQKIQGELYEAKPVFGITHPHYWLRLSVLTDEGCMAEQAVQRGLIFRSVEKGFNRVEDFGVEHTPDTDRLAIELLTESNQKAIIYLTHHSDQRKRHRIEVAFQWAWRDSNPRPPDYGQRDRFQNSLGVQSGALSTELQAQRPFYHSF